MNKSVNIYRNLPTTITESILRAPERFHLAIGLPAETGAATYTCKEKCKGGGF